MPILGKNAIDDPALFIGDRTRVKLNAAVLAVVEFGSFTANGVTPVSVANTKISANSIIIPTLKTVGGTVGAIPAVKTITPGVGFTIAATAADTSVYNYLLLENG